MITTLTVPTSRLGSDSRLLLLLKGSPYAFTEHQLAVMVRWALKDMQSLIQCHCTAAAGAPVGTYFWPDGEDKEVKRAVDEAYELLTYMGWAGTAGPNTFWIRSEPLPL